MEEVNEICLICNHFNPVDKSCKRVIKMRLTIADGAGDLEIHTKPGLIPEYFEESLAEWIMNAVDRWPGWSSVIKLRDSHHETSGCAARESTRAKLSIVKKNGE